MKRFITVVFLLFALTASAQSPKYIFMFIGDGMGYAHLNSAQAALAAQKGGFGFEPLNFTQFPVLGNATTHSASHQITDSAAAGTALATGSKTANGTIGMSADKSKEYESVAVKAKREGLRVGIITSVSIDHATPAAFYAHTAKRSMYDKIAQWLPKSNFDLFAGAGLKDISKNYYDSLKNHFGYERVVGNEATLKGKRVIWTQADTKTPSNIPLTIDREQGDMNLPNMTEKSIDYLDNKKGFFMMIESGQIDWAAHDNDAASIVSEVIDLSEAVEKALEFYRAHKDETLIIVTADHETGGMTIGRDERGYDTNMEILLQQSGSMEFVGKQTVLENNKQAGVDFTTGSHTAATVPVFAIGVGSERFSGMMDNIQIPKIIAELIQSK